MEGEGIAKAIEKTRIEGHSDGVSCVTDKLRVRTESGNIVELRELRSGMRVEEILTGRRTGEQKRL